MADRELCKHMASELSLVLTRSAVDGWMGVSCIREVEDEGSSVETKGSSIKVIGTGTVVNVYAQFAAASTSHDVGFDILGVIGTDVGDTRFFKWLEELHEIRNLDG
jgi:hypothetical protein